MKTQHTPGPWTNHGLTVATVEKQPAQMTHRDPRHIDVAVACYDPEEQDLSQPWDFAAAEANARLIAAAPELVEALGYYVSQHEAHLHAMPEANENEGKEWKRTLQIARAAIAKATATRNA